MKIAKYKLFFAFADSFLISLSLVASVLLTHLYNPLYFSRLSFTNWSVFLLIVLIITHIFIFQANGLYKLNIILSSRYHFTGIIKSVFYSLIWIIFVGFIIKVTFVFDYRLFTIVYSLVLVFLLAVSRAWLFKNLYVFLTNKNMVNSSVLIYGAGKSGRLLGTKILFEKKYGMELAGFIDDNIPVASEILPNINVVSNILDLEVYLSQNGRIDEVLIAIDNITHERLISIVDVINHLNLKIRVSSSLYEVLPQKLAVEKLEEIPIVNFTLQLPGEFNLFMKRIFDFMFSALAVFLFSPFFVLIGLIIKLTSEGPVIYSQIRIGKDGIPFKFYKFRTMRISNEKDSDREKMMIEFMKKNKSQNGNDKKIVNASRITWIGAILRKTSLDEMPQLINVLKGDMSLVGPRPCLPYEYDNYDNWQKKRLCVLPGCTGVWQVWGRSSVSFSDSVVMDLYYVNNMSPWLDLLLILQTVPVMILSRGGK